MDLDAREECALCGGGDGAGVGVGVVGVVGAAPPVAPAPALRWVPLGRAQLALVRAGSGQLAGARYAGLDAALGAPGFGRWLALSRVKLWWMAPSWGGGGAAVPPETQLLLAERQPGGGRYTLLLPLVDRCCRASLRTGRGEGAGAQRRQRQQQRQRQRQRQRQAGGSGGGGGQREREREREREHELCLRVERVSVAGGEEGDGEEEHAAAADGTGAGTGTGGLPSERMALLVACGTDPHALVEAAVGLAAELLGTFAPRRDKPRPAAAELFGWCTWDAFYHGVTPEGVEQGVASLTSAGAPPRVVILDDGWQHTTDFPRNGRRPPGEVAEGRVAQRGALAAWCAALAPDALYERLVKHADAGGAWLRAFGLYTATRAGEATMLAGYRGSAAVASFTARLAGAREGAAFAGGGGDGEAARGGALEALVTRLKKGRGVSLVYCWHAMLGYWGGAAEGVHGAAVARPVHTPGVLEVEPTMAWDPLTLNGSGVPGGGRGDGASMAAFYGELHGAIAAAGADGVKVDVQSMVGALGGTRLARRCHAALEQSVERRFPRGGAACINCMCHSSEALYAQRRTALLRACDDFYPADTASHGAHLAQAAYNSVMLAAFGWPDWDMFQSRCEAGAAHAAARAVSGAPVYVSDGVGQHDAAVLARVVLQSGRVPCATRPALPSRDCLLKDVQRDGQTALKVQSINGDGDGDKDGSESYRVGVVGCFHVQGSWWDVRRRRYASDDALRAMPLRCTVRAGDVEGLVGARSCDGREPATRWAVLGRQGGASDGVRDEVLSLQVVDATHGVELTLPRAGSFAVVAIAPVLHVGDAQVALLGLCDMYNAGGAVRRARLGGHGVAVQTLGPGRFALWADRAPRQARLCDSGALEGPFVVEAECSASEQYPGLFLVDLPPRADGAGGPGACEWALELFF